LVKAEDHIIHLQNIINVAEDNKKTIENELEQAKK
jgi:hypothetical protein